MGNLQNSIDREAITEVINLEDGQATVDPLKAKEIAKEKHNFAVAGAGAGAIAAGVIAVSGSAAVIPGAAVGATIGYLIDNQAVDNVEKVEEDFKKVLEKVEDEEEIKLSRLAMVTHIQTELLEKKYLPYLEEQGFVTVDNEDCVVKTAKPLHQRVLSYFPG